MLCAAALSEWLGNPHNTRQPVVVCTNGTKNMADNAAPPLLCNSLTPPVTPKRPAQNSAHNVTWTDDYAWLKALNWQDVLKEPRVLPADIRKVLEDENEYTSKVLAETLELQKTLVGEMRGRIKEDDSAPAQSDGPYAYYDRFRTGGEQAIVCRRPRDGGDEEVLLDGDREADGAAFFSLSDTAHSPDHRLLAWAADRQGSEYYTVRVRDLTTGEDRDTVADTTGEIAWLADSTGFLYVRLDEKHRGDRVFLHRIGTPASADVLLHKEQDAGLFITVSPTLDGAYVLIDIHDHETSEVRAVDCANAEAVPKLIHPRTVGLRYSVDHHDGRFIIRTSAGGADDYKIVSAPAATPDITQWAEIVPHVPGRLIMRHVCYRGHLVWLERSNATPSIRIRTWGGEEHAIAFDEPTYSLSFVDGLEADTTNLRFTYSSLSTPGETYDYDMATRQRVLIKRREVPSGHEPANYVVERLDAPARDGESVPVSILRHRSTPRDGSAPCLLYGYGSYGIVIPAAFRSNILSLVDRGFVFAIAHVRGGMDKGFRWYKEGKREKKTNTFNDFIDAAEAVIAGGYTRPARIVAQGGSAGGMLMGAIANARPDLFAGVIAEVPFVDVLNTMLDKDLPLTPPEWPEWGNPIESKDAFDVILAYSPYDNVRAQAYPPMLIEAGLTDPRVTYWEPAKWAAQLRATMTSGGPILLNTNMDAGHGGASGRLKQLADDARAYAFALSVTHA